MLAVPFLIIFAEAWLNIGLLTNHYRASELSAQTRQLRSEIEILRDRRHDLERLERIYAEALELGLTEPNPGQIELMEFPETEEVQQVAGGARGVDSP